MSLTNLLLENEFSYFILFQLIKHQTKTFQMSNNVIVYILIICIKEK